MHPNVSAPLQYALLRFLMYVFVISMTVLSHFPCLTFLAGECPCRTSRHCSPISSYPGLPYCTPSYLPSCMRRNTPYGSLAKAYPSGAYITVMEKEEKVFRGDNNWGLVNLAVEKAPRWKLKTLNKTYQTLSLSEIAKEISMPNDASLRELVETMVRIFPSL